MKINFWGLGILFVLASCAAKKGAEADLAASSFASAEAASLESDLGRVDKILEFEKENPSVLSSPERSPAATPEAPGTPDLPPGSHGAQGPQAGQARPGAPLEAFVSCQPSLELRAYGAFPVSTPYGRQLYYPNISSALLALALPTASVSQSAYWDAAMVSSALGDGAYPGSDIEQASQSNPLFDAAFQFAQSKRFDPETVSLAVLTTALIRTADQSECQRQVIERAKVAFQGRPNMDWITIEKQLSDIRGDILRGKAQSVYKDLTESRRALVARLQKSESYKKERQKKLVDNLRHELRKSARCRSNIGFLEMSGALEGASSEQQINLMTDSVVNCLEQVKKALVRAEARQVRNHEFEDKLIAEEKALLSSEKLLNALRTSLNQTEVVSGQEANLRISLKNIESRWVAYHYFLGFAN